MEGSSETTREILEKDFREWLIGFTEGNGSFIVNKMGYLEFKITQTSADAQVLFFIKKQLGFGSVRVQDKLNNTHHFRVRDKDGLFKIIEIFNGRLFLKKRQMQFANWVSAYNRIYGTNILIITNNLEISLNDGWLCGFTDAEGCFNISIVKRSEKYTQVFVRYILSQKYEKEFLDKIAFLLKGSVSFLKSYDGYTMTVNLLNLSRIILYFKKFRLRTRKRIIFVRWLKVYEIVKNKEHLNNSTVLFTIKEIINKNLEIF
jgi:hypothetical protein